MTDGRNEGPLSASAEISEQLEYWKERAMFLERLIEQDEEEREDATVTFWWGRKQLVYAYWLIRSFIQRRNFKIMMVQHEDT